MSGGYSFRGWFVDQWGRAALPLAVVLLCVLPIFADDGNRPFVVLTALLPAYMIHQYEEHARGRFVDFFNATVGQGYDVLTKVSAFWINIVGVWAVFIASLYLARYVDFGFGFIPIYVILVNSVIHVAPAIASRRYNPGLYTALALFLPLGIATLVYAERRTDGSIPFQAIGLAVAVVTHAGIAVYAVRRRTAQAVHAGLKPSEEFGNPRPIDTQ